MSDKVKIDISVRYQSKMPKYCQEKLTLILYAQLIIVIIITSIAAAAGGSRRHLPKAGVERSSYVGIAYTISVKPSN